MPDHADFAAAITIRKSTLEDLLHGAYAGDRFPHAFSFSNQFGTVTGELFLAEPTMSFSPGDNTIRVELRGWGPIDMHPDIRDVVAIAHVAVTPTFGAATPARPAGLRFGVTTVLDFDYFTTDGPFTPDDDRTLRGGAADVARELLNNTLGTFSLDLLTDALPLGQIVRAAATDGVCRVFDDALVVGVAWPALTLPRTGELQRLVPFGTRGIDAVVPVDTVFGEFGEIHAIIGDQVRAFDAELESLTVTVGTEALNVSLVAGNSEGALDVRFALHPELDAPGQAGRRLRFRASDVSFKGHSRHSALDRFFDFFTSPGDNEPDVNGIIQAAVGGWSMPAELRVLVPGTTVPTFTARLLALEPSPDGLLVSSELELVRKQAFLNGPAIVTPEMAAEPVTFRLVLPITFLTDDPKFRLEWTVREERPADSQIGTPPRGTGPQVGPGPGTAADPSFAATAEAIIAEGFSAASFGRSAAGGPSGDGGLSASGGAAAAGSPTGAGGVSTAGGPAGAADRFGEVGNPGNTDVGLPVDHILEHSFVLSRPELRPASLYVISCRAFHDFGSSTEPLLSASAELVVAALRPL